MIIENSEGFELRLRQICQAQVYEGLLEGLPTRRINNRLIESCVAQAGELFRECPVHLIEPEQKEIEHEGEYRFGEPARLPGIVCMARFTSWGRDPTFLRVLGVVWFQDRFALPIDDGVVEQLKTLEWGRISEEREL